MSILNIVYDQIYFVLTLDNFWQSLCYRCSQHKQAKKTLKDLQINVIIFLSMLPVKEVVVDCGYTGKPPAEPQHFSDKAEM